MLYFHVLIFIVCWPYARMTGRQGIRRKNFIAVGINCSKIFMAHFISIKSNFMNRSFLVTTVSVLLFTSCNQQNLQQQTGWLPTKFIRMPGHIIVLIFQFRQSGTTCFIYKQWDWCCRKGSWLWEKNGRWIHGEKLTCSIWRIRCGHLETRWSDWWSSIGIPCWSLSCLW